MTHLEGELLQRETGTKLIHVPFRSTINSLTDLMDEHIDAIFGDVAILRPHVEGHAVKALGIRSCDRSPLLPDLVAMKETGFPGVHTDVWYGLSGPGPRPGAGAGQAP